MQKTTKYFPIVLTCNDPENCSEEHNEIAGWENDNDRMHHYGCECTDCMLYYYLKLK